MQNDNGNHVTTRCAILVALAGVCVFVLLRQLYQIIPQATARVFVGFLIVSVLVSTGWRLSRTQRFGIRTLVVVLPIVAAAICFPMTYVAENRRLIAQLDKAGISKFDVKPQGQFPKVAGRWFESLFGNRVSELFATRLTYVHLNLATVDEDELHKIPAEYLELVHLAKYPQATRLTLGVIDWLNQLPGGCLLFIGLHGLSEEESRYLTTLDREVHSLRTYHQVLSKATVYSLLRLNPRELWIDADGLAESGSFKDAPECNIEMLTLGSNGLFESDLLDLVQTANPRTLRLLGVQQPLTPDAFSTVFKLPRIEGVSLWPAWVTYRHLESISNSQTLRWVAVHSGSNLVEDDFETLRKTAPQIRINGKSYAGVAKPASAGW